MSLSQSGNRIFFLSFLFVLTTKSAITSLFINVSPNDNLINIPSTYNWNVEYSNSVGRQNFGLYFPTCIQISSTTNVFFNNAPVSVTGFTTNNINFTLPSVVVNQFYFFTVNNVKNCFQAKGVRQFRLWNNADGLVESTAGVNTILFKEGTIPSCQLKFNGNTGDVSSVLNIDFKIQNFVRGLIFGVRISFSSFYSSNTQLLTTDNFTCSLKVNGTSLNFNNKAIDTANKQLTCSFFSNTTTITVNDNFNLILSNVNNPITSRIYFGSDEFTLTTFDAQDISIDKTTSFTLIPVPISTYVANFSISRAINRPMSPIRLSTIANIPFRIFRNDQILIIYTSGFFSTLGTQCFVGRANGSTPVQFAYKPSVSTSNLALSFINNGSRTANSFNYPIDIQLPNFIYTMPPSTKPVSFTITFSGMSQTGSGGGYDQFMQINSTLIPYYSNVSQNQLNLSLSVNTIGDNSTYTFTFVNLEKLDQKPKVIIDFPSQINISNSGSLSLCSILINNIGIGTKNCQFKIPNSVQINFTSTNQINPNSTLVFALPNIKNPSSPISVSGFNIRTYYNSEEPQGLVQVGQNLNMSLSYGPRTVYPYIPTDNFTVFTDQKNFTVVYQTGVDLPTGSVVTITFNDKLKNVLYEQCNPLKFSLSQNASGVFKLTSTQPLTSGISINITFSCSTPNRTGIYSVLHLQTTFNNVPYQKTQSDVTFQVVTPYFNIFTVTPANNLTGATTSYTFSFSTIVPHQSILIVQIVFPAGTDMLNGQSNCNTGCNTTNISDSSSGSLDKLQVVLYKNISVLTAPYVYTFTLNNIKNQREVGSSGDFQFTTLTNETRQKILRGLSSVAITAPSPIIGKFYQTDDYYLQNSNPVKIQFNLTNKLQIGDYLSITFTIKSYTVLNNQVSCAEGTCSFENTTATSFDLKFVPSITQIIQLNIFVEVYGLLSAADTLYGQFIPVTIRSKSSNNKLIDQGVFSYRVSCGDNLPISLKNCKTCIRFSSTNYNCTSCYPPLSLFQSDLCVPNCSNMSSLSTYSSQGFCIPCIIPCQTCLNQTYCSRCITGFYLITERHVCSSSCNTSSGYYIYVLYSAYLYCQKCTTQNCISCPNDRCDACFGSMVVENGNCLGDCISGTFNLGGICTRCDASCVTCNGISNLNCFSCSPGYYSFSGACISGCPSGSVNTTNGTCGCGPSCGTCAENENRCLSCSNLSFFIYNYGCSQFCPNGTYAFGKQCLDCSNGCNKCSSTTCIECKNNFNIFENRCYQNCKEIGPRFISRLVNGVYRCDQCPDGCTNCTETFVCLQCLQSYTLNGSFCKRQCQLTNTCDLSPTSDPIVPLPGLISFGIWAIIIIVLKLVFIKGIYPPYSLLFAGALIQYILLITNLVSISIKYSGSAARLLQVTQVSNDLLVTPLGLIAVGLLLNYVMNIVLIWVFKKFIKPLIIPRQIDLISNYVTFIFSILTTYRFYLLAFCRLFKKPHVQVKSAEKITVFRRILCVSYLLDLIPFVGAIVLVSNSTKLSILYMLGIDLILIIMFLWMIFIWTMIWDKPEEYYSQTKKYALQENHMTQQASIQNNEKEISKAQIRNDTNEKLNVEEYVGEDNVDNMPTKQTNFIHVEGKKPEKIDQVMEESGYKTRRRQKKDDPFEKSSEKKIGRNNGITIQDVEKKKIVEQQNKQKSERILRDQYSVLEKKKPNHPLSPKKLELGLESGKKNTEDVYEFDDNEIEFEKELNIAERPTKLKPTMKSSTKIDKPLVTGMKKKKMTGAFESDMGQSQIDQVDLESILQTKVIDRSKSKKMEGQAHTEAGKRDHLEYEQISPSWFNIQNQRYDINEGDDD